MYKKTRSTLFKVARYFLALFVILNGVKNLRTFTLCIQILRDAQDDNLVLTDISFPFFIKLTVSDDFEYECN